MHLRYFITIFLILFPPWVAAADFIFSPKFCEFSVQFPVQYKTYEIIKSGNIGLSARAKTIDLTGLNAECWAFDKPLQIEILAQELEKEMQKRGVSVGIVIIDKNNDIAPQIILSGNVNPEGKKLFIKMISFIGHKSILELLIVEKDLVSQTQVNFRNNVKLK